MNEQPTEVRGATQDEIAVIREAQVAAMRVANLMLTGEDVVQLREAIRMGRARFYVEFEPHVGAVRILADWPEFQRERLEIKALIPNKPRANA